MFDYKKPDFFNEYFSKLEGYSVCIPFTLLLKGEGTEEKELIIGEIEKTDSPHPIELRVEIPIDFPHHNLRFWTCSLFGYPHLIYNYKDKDGNLWNWFCLNTPFAETPEAQLDLEVYRLNEWFKRQLSPLLPAIIDDEDVRHSLRMANAYDWEISNEMEEWRVDAFLTFIGNWAKKSSNFNDQSGTFNCIRNGSNKIYVLEEGKGIANFKLPYVIVDEIPGQLEDFILLRQQYGWDDKLCLDLLSGIDSSSRPRWSVSHVPYIFGKKKMSFIDFLRYGIQLSEEEAIKILDDSLSNILIPEEDKDTVYKKVEEIRSEIKKNKGIDHKYPIDPNMPLPEFPKEDDNHISQVNEEYNEILEAERLDSISCYGAHCFALGVRTNEEIFWRLIWTSKSHMRFREKKYEICIYECTLQRPASLKIFFEKAQYINTKCYFGRGQLAESLVNKSIAIIGLGALGSQISVSMARSGVSRIGLWDKDLVEPGNICRSAYSICNLGENKQIALEKIIESVSPFCSVKHNSIKWSDDNDYGYPEVCIRGDFYGDTNYDPQEYWIKQLESYDIIIDATGSNELLHFLSYGCPKDKILISLCITNHSSNLLMMTNADGNPFELRKAYLSKIEQDANNYYVEGSGCYSPTFLAKNCDIACLINLAVREISDVFEKNTELHSTIFSYERRRVVIDRLRTYELEGNDIKLVISDEILDDAIDLYDSPDGAIGYILGTYSFDGKMILVTHFISSQNAEQKLERAYLNSKGIIDYIGDFVYSDGNGKPKNEDVNLLIAKACNPEVNTNNPLLATRNTDGTMSFYLLLNGSLHCFREK